MSQLFASDGQSIGASASTSVLPMNIQGWFPLGLTGLISLLSKGLSRVFSSTTIGKHQFFSAQPFLWSNSHMITGKTIALAIKRTFVNKLMSLLFNMLSRLVITFLPRSKCLLIWLLMSISEFCLVTQSCPTLHPHGLQQARLPCPSPTPGVYSNSHPLSWWCHPNISSSVIPFSSRLQSFPASGFFPVSQFFTSSGQSVGVSASASVLPMNIQDWSPLRWTGWISLQSNGLTRVFSNSKASILRCSAFFIVQLSHPYMITGKTIALTRWTLLAKLCLCFLICCLGWSSLSFQGASI